MSKLTLILSISLFIQIISPSKDFPSPSSWIVLSFATVLNDGDIQNDQAYRRSMLNSYSVNDVIARVASARWALVADAS